MHSSLTSTTTTSSTHVSSACEEPSSKFTVLPHDVFRSHILPRLDGCTLASVGCTTPELLTLTSDQDLWSHLCHSTWPSTTSPRLQQLISDLPGGSRTFFSQSYPPLPSTLSSPPTRPTISSSLPESLISAVDIFYRGKCIYSKVQETETVTGWFSCSPFRVDLLEPKESVPTPIRRPSHEDTCRDLYTDLELSWILMMMPMHSGTKGVGHSAINVSSLRPVSVEKHWLTGEVHVRYAAVVGHVMFGVDVKCVGCGPGGLVLHVNEVCLRLEDMDGVNLNGKDSLVILQQVFEGRRGNCGKGRRVEEGRKRYLEYLERKSEWREKKLKREGRLDLMCVIFGVLFFASLFCWSALLAILLKVMSLPVFRPDQMRTRVRFVPS